MLYGYVSGPGGRKITLFPEDYEEFHRYFVDSGNRCIKNKGKFQDRIFGLVSYSGVMYEHISSSQTGKPGVIARKGFPDEAPTIVERVPMSHKQYADYILAKHKEEQEAGHIYGQNAKVALERPSFQSSSTYKVQTRQICNMLLPNNITKEKKIADVHLEDWKALDVYSPKYQAIINNMKKHKINIVYSQFKGIQGIGGLMEALKANEKFTAYDLKTHKGGKNQFIQITGDVPPQDRQKLLDVFKASSNKDGSTISTLLVTSAGAEGIDTTNARATHMIEPYWNPSREDQFKARAIRIRSHDDLPAKDRIVQPYVYLSVPPADVQKGAKELNKRLLPTTDEELYIKSKRSRLVLKSFRFALIEATFDCLMLAPVDDKKKTKSKKTPVAASMFEDEGLSCKICQPTNVPLYHDNIMDDMKSISPCKPYIEEKLTVKEVKVDGKKYYYKKPTPVEEAQGYGLEIYEYSEVLDAYSPIDQQNPLFDLIAAKIK